MRSRSLSVSPPTPGTSRSEGHSRASVQLCDCSTASSSRAKLPSTPAAGCSGTIHRAGQYSNHSHVGCAGGGSPGPKARGEHGARTGTPSQPCTASSRVSARTDTATAPHCSAVSAPRSSHSPGWCGLSTAALGPGAASLGGHHSTQCSRGGTTRRLALGNSSERKGGCVSEV